VSGER